MRARRLVRLSEPLFHCAFALLLVVAQGGAQSLQGPAPSQSTPPVEARSNSNSSVLDSDSFSTTRNALTATQINRILQERPELIVELKSLFVDQLHQQNINAQPDEITDEALYSQISANPDLRSNITVWLRARGYLSNSSGSDDKFRPSRYDFDQPTIEEPTSSALSQSPLDASRVSNGELPFSALSTLKSTESNLLPSTATSRALSSRQTRTSVGPEVEKPARTVVDEPSVLHVPSPYNLRSLRDLYSQIPQDDVKLKRFGSEVFLNRETPASTDASSTSRNLPIDVPVGPDYVLGTGDGLTINLWGGISQSFTRAIDREGKIVLPEAGPLVVAGLTLERAQTTIAGALKQQFKNVQVDITIARLRSLRVYVVGDVQRPGAYELSSLSTPLNALYAAGGPTSVGSLRIVRHYRGTQLIREIDLYDFLIHGMRLGEERLQAGDTLLVPPTGPQVAVSGMVKRPAIYELKASTTLAELLDDAGGATVAAALNHINIERIQPNQQRETITLALTANSSPKSALQAIDTFAVKDGDRIYIAPILPYSERVIYVEGHVPRPGKYPYRDGIQIGDIVRSYRDLLPEPATRGDIVRLMPPDLHPETIPFDIPDVLIGNTPITLQPFDTIRIFGRYQLDPPQVAIRGEVLRPGLYALSHGMTAAQLVNMAGGLKRDALLESADLTSYTVQDQKKVVSHLASINIGAAVKLHQPKDDVPLRPGDVLTIHQISGWNDIGASIILEGEATYPGSYGLQEGERLSSVLRRAGGFRPTAYPAGAVLIRGQVQELEEKSRAELIHQIETASVSARLSPSLTGQDQTATLQAIAQQQNEVLQRLRTQPANGRLVIHLTADIDSWADTPADIELRKGDTLTIPKRPGFVLVSGQVYNPSAQTFVPGKDAAWYLRRAGGTSETANRQEIFIVRANGSVVGRRSGEWYAHNVLSSRLDPGDVIVVPQKIMGGSLVWRNLLTVAQIASSIAITAAVAGVL